MEDVFIVSANAESVRFSRLMNKASREYWHLKDRTTNYAKSIFACYYLNKKNYERTLQTIDEYKKGNIMEE